MAGISSKAAGGLENKKKYNGIEFDNDLDLNLYEAFYRNLDPQTGRWWQIDPKCEPGEDDNEEGLESLSPYNSMNNDPVRLSDPLGDCPTCPVIWRQGEEIAQSLPPQAHAIAEVATGIVVGVVALYELFKDVSLDDVAKSMAATGNTSLPMTMDLYIKKGASDAAKAQIAPPKPAVPTVVQTTKKGPKDLVGDAKLQQQKEADTKARAANRQAQTTQGKTKQGQSNQDVRGSHHSSKGNSDDYQKANARRAADQKAADAKKEADKKKTN